MLLRLQGTLVYGPVRSRRLGWSLGINALPLGRKTCTFDCLYCQYGRATPVPPDAAAGFPAVDEVLAAIEAALTRDIPRPAYLTFSGNGEPTLHPQFGDLVEGVVALRNRFIPEARVALLSNSSRASDPSTYAALCCLDERIMKLDAGTETLLEKFNRPWSGLTLTGIVDGLASMPNVTIQTLLAGGPQGNACPDDIEALIVCLGRIKPREVQLYTLDRESPTSSLLRLDPGRLDSIGRHLHHLGIPATAF